MKLPRALHPLFFAAFPVLFLYARNVASVPSSDVMQALGGALAVAIILTALIWVAVRDLGRAAVAASVVLIFVYTYGPLATALEDRSWLAEDIELAIVWSAVGFLVAVVAARTKRAGPTLTRLFTVVAAVLVVMPAVSIATQILDLRSFGESPAAAAAPTRSVSATEKRDIYYIVLDRYAGRDTLRRRYDFDNREFLRDLKRRGFFVANSWANYPRTTHSLASSLNMRYLDRLAERVGPDYERSEPLFDELKDPEVVQTLKSAGYRYALIPSWWRHTANDPAADIRLASNELLTPFSRALVESTLLSSIATAVNPETLDVRKDHWKLTRRQFERLEEVSALDGPVFAFAHILLPHDPYVFRRDGSFQPSAEAKARPFKDKYLDQLQYANDRVTRLLDKLLSVPEDEQPIIILQSDEGPFPPRHARHGSEFRWDLARPEELEIKMNILNAYHFPGVDDPGLYKHITPVNSFRVLLNNYFDADLDLLPDRIITWEDGDSLYSFHDVTDAVETYRRLAIVRDRVRAAREADSGNDR